MNEVATIVFLTMAAGACIPLGGYLASFERIRSRWLEQELRHFLIALGSVVGFSISLFGDMLVRAV